LASIDQESRSTSRPVATNLITKTSYPPERTDMASLEYVTIEVADLAAANRFYTTALGLGDEVLIRASEAQTTGFRGFTLSLIVSSRPPSTASSTPPSTPAPRC
jgi:catechol-2,3-dioxygenase